MQFYIDHDWQENMATPRAKVGENTNTYILILFSALWLCVGLIGHSPWKPYESQSVSIIQSLLDHPVWLAQSWSEGIWIAPTSAGHPELETPPLFYWLAAGISYALQPILSTHDAARLSVGLWMLLTLTMMGLSGRELWNKGIGRQTNFIFIGCLGLVISAHTIMPAATTLSGLSMSFYALALALRKPIRATFLLAGGIAISFLSQGLLPVAIVILSALCLCMLPGRWRNLKVIQALVLAVVVALPFILLWCLLCHRWAPLLWDTWWHSQIHIFTPSKHWLFLRTLAWSAWPALPFALWGAWRFRSDLFKVHRFQLCMVFFSVAFILTGFLGNRVEVHVLPLLIPLSAMAAGSVETLKRGAAGALNWFGLILFGLLIGIGWLGWWAMLNGYPLKLHQRLSYLSGLKSLEFNLLYCSIAAAVTMIWVSTALLSKPSNRSSATNWTVGITCTWTVFMSLWLPMLDAAHSYRSMFEDLRKHLPMHYQCINLRGIGSAQIDLLHYHADISPQILFKSEVERCDLYLIADEADKRLWLPGSHWKTLWQAENSRQNRESFRLLQKLPANAE